MQKDIIAFWGYPEKEIINQTKTEYPKAVWVDLDIDYGYKKIDFLPENYCTIMKNIFTNAFYYKERIIKISKFFI